MSSSKGLQRKGTEAVVEGDRRKAFSLNWIWGAESDQVKGAVVKQSYNGAKDSEGKEK